MCFHVFYLLKVCFTKNGSLKSLLERMELNEFCVFTALQTLAQQDSNLSNYNAKFVRAPFGRNRSSDAILSLLSGTYQRILAILAQNLALDDKNNRGILSQALCVIGSLGNLMCKLHISSPTTFLG